MCCCSLIGVDGGGDENQQAVSALSPSDVASLAGGAQGPGGCMSDEAAEVKLAYARLFSDNPRAGDGMTVLLDMANYAGFYGVPSIAAWPGGADGYAINCHEHNGKRALFARVSRFAALTEDEMLRLERAARFTPIEDV
jgi:hypothetical protein